MLPFFTRTVFRLLNPAVDKDSKVQEDVKFGSTKMLCDAEHLIGVEWNCYHHLVFVYFPLCRCLCKLLWDIIV